MTQAQIDLTEITRALSSMLPARCNIHSVEAVIRLGGGVQQTETIVLRAVVDRGLGGRRYEIAGSGEDVGTAAVDLQNAAIAWSTRTRAYGR